uniref:40S ribosomal protein S4 n=1 Tax=Timema shepardi TaxID=629360 RepID=A0A7R9B0R3_TIMSH|nr:unnamed protein product [Timema shepardi]
MIRLFQARGPKKHLKRLNAPKAWMLDKLGGVYAPRPSTGPHKLRESLPLVIFLRNRLKYALTNCEVKKIVKQRLVKVDGKIRTDPNYPTGFMDLCENYSYFKVKQKGITGPLTEKILSKVEDKNIGHHEMVTKLV